MISLSTACRIGELLMAEWKHVNLEIGAWFIPKKNAKGKRGKKAVTRLSISPLLR